MVRETLAHSSPLYGRASGQILLRPPGLLHIPEFVNRPSEERPLSGYLRVRHEIASYPTMRFDYRESGDGYLVRLEYKEQRTEISRKGSPKGSPKTADKILELIRENPQISTAKIGEELGISKRAVLKQTSGLKTAGRLCSRGQRSEDGGQSGINLSCG